MQKETSTIILAAGKGVRMKSELPKVAFKLGGISLIERVVRKVEKLTFSKIVVVIGYKKAIVKKCLADYDNIIFVDQEVQNGTGHAVMVTENHFSKYDGNIIIIPGDVPLLSLETLVELKNLHNSENASATVLTAVLDNPTDYGRIVRDNNGFIEKIVEFKDANKEERKIHEINSGIFCFDAKSLFSALSKINSNNIQKELYLTDTLEVLRKEGKKISALTVKDSIEVSGVNSREQLAFLENYIQK
ncbi:MAG: NTP transferase domain-containing protein [Candidatus Cloacimonetes bacterium]|nr:NTP transferase domain-containing protein [Candidatus Cloacimonadota bacterium]